jgi:hypothetical protein
MRLFIALAFVASTIALAGCGSTIASMPLIGEPDIAQNRPAVQPEYRPVFGKPVEPENKPMTAAERDKLQAELAAEREGAADAKRKKINQPAR